jgi:mannose-6-phosphate isomerase-like protein (cupin superfamily)
MLVTVTNNENVLAIIIKAAFKKEGIEFFTSNKFSQQVAYMNRPKKYVIPAHLHHPVPRDILHTKEVLFIKSGKLRIDFYDDDKKYIESRVLEKGDTIILCYGGHGFEMIEPTEILEVKQGPYVGENDKERFPSVEKSKIIIKGDT